MAEADWKQGLFGCFGNLEICLCGYFCPCILGYRNAENLGEEGLLYGLLYFVAPCVSRESYNYKGYTIIVSLFLSIDYWPSDFLPFMLLYQKQEHYILITTGWSV